MMCGVRRTDTRPRHRSQPWISSRLAFVACYTASGAAALVYEVTWTRLFTLHLGPTVGAASTVLAAFMGGLAAGAWLAGRRLPPAASRLRSYAALEAGIAATALAIPTALRALDPILAAAYANGAAPARFATVRVLLSLLILIVPAAAMGATFPVAAAWFSADARRRSTRARWRPATHTSLLYAMNTAGAAAGALAAGFWLLPSFGIRATTIAGVALNGAAAAGAWWLARHEGPETTVPDRPAA